MFERLINWREQPARARTGLSRAAASHAHLADFDAHRDEAAQWMRRDCSSSATSGLFGYAYGREWASAISG